MKQGGCLCTEIVHALVERTNRRFRHVPALAQTAFFRTLPESSGSGQTILPEMDGMRTELHCTIEFGIFNEVLGTSGRTVSEWWASKSGIS